MTRLKSLLIKIRRAVLIHQVQAVDARQRTNTANVLYASTCRMFAEDEYQQRSAANTKRKAQLLAKLEALHGKHPA